MFVDQISVLIENQTGRMAQLTAALAGKDVDIKGVCVTDTVDYGICRLIVSDTDAAITALTDGGFTASVTKVIAVELDDVPGGLNFVLTTLKDYGISLDYIYSINVIEGDKAGIIIKVGEPEAAAKVLAEANIRTYDQKELSTYRGAKKNAEEGGKAPAGKLRDMLNDSDRL